MRRKNGNLVINAPKSFLLMQWKIFFKGRFVYETLDVCMEDMMCIYVQSVNQQARWRKYTNAFESYRDQYNASSSHLFVHAVVHQPRHARYAMLLLLCFYCTKHAYDGPWMHVSLGQERCILFLDPCNENNVSVFNSFGCQHVACMPQQALRPAGLHRQGVVVEHCGLAYRKLARNWTTCLEDRCWSCWSCCCVAVDHACQSKAFKQGIMMHTTTA